MITKITHTDTIEISKILKNSKATTTHMVVKEMLDHINDGVALKYMEDNKIVGIWFSKEYEEYTSLSYFYVDESIRRKPQLAVFFKTCADLLNKTKPVLITANDTTGFDRYVEQIGEKLFRFKGLR